MVFDDEFSTVPLLREGTITPNWTDLVQHIVNSGATQNIEFKDNWITPDLEEYPQKPQVTNRASLKRIITKCSRRCSLNHKHKKVRPKREPLKCMHV